LSTLTAVCISSANLIGTLPSFDANVVSTLAQLRLDNNGLSGRHYFPTINRSDLLLTV